MKIKFKIFVTYLLAFSLSSSFVFSCGPVLIKDEKGNTLAEFEQTGRTSFSFNVRGGCFFKVERIGERSAGSTVVTDLSTSIGELSWLSETTKRKMVVNVPRLGKPDEQHYKIFILNRVYPNGYGYTWNMQNFGQEDSEPTGCLAVTVDDSGGVAYVKFTNFDSGYSVSSTFSAKTMIPPFFLALINLICEQKDEQKQRRQGMYMLSYARIIILEYNSKSETWDP
jgi:hypothetical protein